tara:strand:- start:1009 stop:1683 length:675 start_codon:yes stop_codon:yes gene_type:complete
MNKITITKVLSLVLLSFSLITLSKADVKWGVSLSAIDMSPSAKEELWSYDSESQPADQEDIVVPMGSIFVERDLGVVSVGVDLVPYRVKSEELDNVRTNSGAAGDQDTTDAKVEVEVEFPITLYALLKNDTGAFLKLGASYANVKTNETTPTGSQYPDAEIYGGHVAIGYEGQLGATEYNFRIEGGYSGYTNITVANDQGSRATKVHVNDMDGPTARVSILKAF